MNHFSSSLSVKTALILFTLVHWSLSARVLYTGNGRRKRRSEWHSSRGERKQRERRKKQTNKQTNTINNGFTTVLKCCIWWWWWWKLYCNVHVGVRLLLSYRILDALFSRFHNVCFIACIFPFLFLCEKKKKRNFFIGKPKGWHVSIFYEFQLCLNYNNRFVWPNWNNIINNNKKQ